MRQRNIALLVGMAAIAAAGCGPKLLVPPRLDLVPFGQVGLITFTVENAKGDLNQLATEYFAAEVLASQGGMEVLELGELETVLNEVGRERLEPRTAQAVGDAYDVPAVFVGHMKVSDVKPRAALVRFPSVEAVVSVQITVRLVSTESGGTMWSNSARATESVGGIALTDREIIFDAEDPNDAYGHLVEHLVYELTRDFRPTYR
jgi:hypothetical protein